MTAAHRVQGGRRLVVLLAGCNAIAGFTTNFFLPALPSIREQFAVSVAAAQTTVSAYLIAFALAVLLAGPVSDRLGRRPLILGGLAVFAAGSMLAAAAPNLAALVVARVIQAVGAACCLVVSRAVAGDIYEGNELARMIAMITMVQVLSTTLSPLAGGVIVTRYGWHAGFWILVGAGALLAAACARLLPETASRARDAGRAGTLLRQARALLVQGPFCACMLQASTIFSVFIVFIALAPYIMVGAFHRPITDFGLYYFMISGGYFLGNLFVSKVAHRIDSDRLTKVGLALQLAGALAALAFGLAGFTHPMWVFGPMLPLSFGQGLALANVSARAVTLAPGYAGVATSLVGFTQQVIAGIGVQAMGWAPVDSALPILWFCAGMSALALLPALLSHGISRASSVRASPRRGR